MAAMLRKSFLRKLHLYSPFNQLCWWKPCCHLKYSSMRDKVLLRSPIVWFNLYGSFTKEWTQGILLQPLIIVSGILFLLSTHQNSICLPHSNSFAHMLHTVPLSFTGKGREAAHIWWLHALIIAFLPRKPLPAFCTMWLAGNLKSFSGSARNTSEWRGKSSR